jgi:hypothetical protein
MRLRRDQQVPVAGLQALLLPVGLLLSLSRQQFLRGRGAEVDGVLPGRLLRCVCRKVPPSLLQVRVLPPRPLRHQHRLTRGWEDAAAAFLCHLGNPGVGLVHDLVKVSLWDALAGGVKRSERPAVEFVVAFQGIDTVAEQARALETVLPFQPQQAVMAAFVQRRVGIVRGEILVVAEVHREIDPAPVVKFGSEDDWPPLKGIDRVQQGGIGPQGELGVTEAREPSHTAV